LTLASAYGAAPPPPLADRTPENWRDLLLARLAAQRFEIAVPEAYYNGDHPLQFATSKFREAFGSLFAAFADNWCPIVVDAPVERLAIIGFRFGDGTSGDEDAWRIWQRSSLDVESVIAHTEAGKCGRAYLLVDPNDGDPRITVEHASQVVVACDPASRRRRLAALKQWWGDDGFLYATLYLPDFIFKWQSADAVTDMAPEIEWVPRRDENDGPNPFGEVPVIELQNTPGLMRGGESDLKPAMPIQNAVNKLCTDMLVASEFGAFRQRVLTGVEIPKDPDTGKPLAQAEIQAAMSRLWTFESTEARAYDLPPTDLSNFVVAIEMFIQHLAAQTHTPPHYLIGQVVNASGDALKAAEAGLTSKCRRKILYFSDPWEDAMALALRAVGRNVDAADGEVLWADPEQRSLGEVTDALVKKRTLGVPLEQIWLEMGYTPAQVTDLKRQAGLPERPPAGATTAALPPVLGGSSSTPDAQQQ
jgi:hypothetical protein